MPFGQSFPAADTPLPLDWKRTGLSPFGLAGIPVRPFCPHDPECKRNDRGRAGIGIGPGPTLQAKTGTDTMAARSLGCEGRRLDGAHYDNDLVADRLQSIPPKASGMIVLGA